MPCRLQIIVALLIAVLALPAAWAQTVAIGVAESVAGEVFGDNLLRPMRAGEDVFRNQRLKVGVDSAADLRFLDGSRLMVGPRSEIVLDEFVYNPDKTALQGTVNLMRGVLRFASSALDRDVTFKTPTAVIGVRGTVFDVLSSNGSTEVVVHEGRVEVSGRHGSVVLEAGQSVVLGGAASPIVTELDASGENRGTPVMRRAIDEMLAKVDGVAKWGTPQHAQGERLPGPDANASPRVQERPRSLPANSVARARAATTASGAPQSDVAGIASENLLYLDLVYGRVVIEMRPDLAPRHVARIRELTRSGFYDGLKFHSVLAGRFAMTGDPTGTGRGGSGVALDAEFSRESFRRGSVGMAHDRGKPDSADSQFFISLEDFPEIEGKYTLWGQVVEGMQFVDQLRRGNPPQDPDIILRARIAADFAG